MNWEECSEKTNQKIICLKDPKGGKSKFYLQNDSQIEVIKVKVDGCLKIQGKRCDYLIKIDQPIIEIYIELKGSRVQDALGQIENTIKQISHDPYRTVKLCYIIHTRCPQSTDLQKIIKQCTLRFRKEYNARLLIKKSGFKEKLTNLY
ncbi:MAG: hypothetical protein AB4058_07800 [Microcystaceae cyanobacterium]